MVSERQTFFSQLSRKRFCPIQSKASHLATSVPLSFSRQPFSATDSPRSVVDVRSNSLNVCQNGSLYTCGDRRILQKEEETLSDKSTGAARLEEVLISICNRCRVFSVSQQCRPMPPAPRRSRRRRTSRRCETSSPCRRTRTVSTVTSGVPPTSTPPLALSSASRARASCESRFAVHSLKAGRINLSFKPFLIERTHRRGLTPPHRVKSISMASFTCEEIEFLRSRGNSVSQRETNLHHISVHDDLRHIYLMDSTAGKCGWLCTMQTFRPRPKTSRNSKTFWRPSTRRSGTCLSLSSQSFPIKSNQISPLI